MMMAPSSFVVSLAGLISLVLPVALGMMWIDIHGRRYEIQEMGNNIRMIVVSEKLRVFTRLSLEQIKLVLENTDGKQFTYKVENSKDEIRLRNIVSWPSFNSGLSDVNKKLHTDVEKVIIGYAQEDELKGEKIVGSMEWGPGRGWALEDILSKLQMGGIKNEALLCFGDTFDQGWLKLDNETIPVYWILDSSEPVGNLTQYFETVPLLKKIKLKMIFGINGLNYLSLIESFHFEELAVLLDPGGVILVEGHGMSRQRLQQAGLKETFLLPRYGDEFNKAYQLYKKEDFRNDQRLPAFGLGTASMEWAWMILGLGMILMMGMADAAVRMDDVEVERQMSGVYERLKRELAGELPQWNGSPEESQMAVSGMGIMWALAAM